MKAITLNFKGVKLDIEYEGKGCFIYEVNLVEHNGHDVTGILNFEENDIIDAIIKDLKTL